MIRRLLPTVLVADDGRHALDADNLDLFEVVHPRACTPGYGSLDLSRFEGRRVGLVGRSAVAAGFAGLPPFRWLRLGRPGEPAEVCRLSDGSALGWLADECARVSAIERAWTALPHTSWVYHFARGEFGRIRERDAPPTWDVQETTAPILTTITRCAAGVRRFGGGGVDLLGHSLIVCAALPPRASPTARRLALIHDHHEVLAADLSTPLKRIVGEEWREIEQLVARVVERLAGLEPTDEDRAAVRVADQVALRVEAQPLGIDLGDPEALDGVKAALAAAERWDYVSLWRADQVVDLWWREWQVFGGGAP